MKSLPIILLIAAILFLCFFYLGSITLFDVDEAVFAEATKEMVQSSNWITPTYNGETRYDKPILFYWLTAVSYEIFGINEVGARFPSAFAAFLLVVAMFFFMRYSGGDKAALYAVLSMVFNLYFLIYAHAGVTDMVLTLFITVSLFSFYLSLVRDTKFIYGFYAFSALAFLTKGLIGIVFPFGIAIIYLLVSEGIRGTKKVFSFKAALLFLGIAGPWYAAQLAINGNEFFQQFFIKHHFRRYTDVISGHKGPFYYYILALSVGLFPWIAFLPAGIRKLIKAKDSLDLLACIWFAFVVVFFSFATTKLPNYILPAIPAAVILISSGMSQQNIRWEKGSLAFIAIVSFSLGIAFFFLTPLIAKIGITGAVWIFVPAAIMLVMAVLSAYHFITGKPSYVIIAFIMFAFLTVLLVRALPVANQYLQGTLYKFSIYAKEKAGGDEKIITYGVNNPSIVFYSGHRVVNIRDRDTLIAHIREKKDNIAIIKTKDIGIMNDTGFTLVDKDNVYALFKR